MDAVIYQTVNDIGISKKRIKKMIFQMLIGERADVDVSVHFIGDRKMAALNGRHRGIKKPTDVLSFSAMENPIKNGFHGDIGDIFIDAQHVKRQAKAWGERFENEIIRVIAHGILHLLGYEHINKAGAEKMFKKQEYYVKKYESAKI